jgi:hypothetical protein
MVWTSGSPLPFSHHRIVDPDSGRFGRASMMSFARSSRDSSRVADPSAARSALMFSLTLRPNRKVGIPEEL